MPDLAEITNKAKHQPIILVGLAAGGGLLLYFIVKGGQGGAKKPPSKAAEPTPKEYVQTTSGEPTTIGGQGMGTTWVSLSYLNSALAAMEERLRQQYQGQPGGNPPYQLPTRPLPPEPVPPGSNPPPTIPPPGEPGLPPGGGLPGEPPPGPPPPKDPDPGPLPGPGDPGKDLSLSTIANGFDLLNWRSQ